MADCLLPACVSAWTENRRLWISHDDLDHRDIPAFARTPGKGWKEGQITVTKVTWGAAGPQWVLRTGNATPLECAIAAELPNAYPPA
jgi:hypothetical protein